MIKTNKTKKELLAIIETFVNDMRDDLSEEARARASANGYGDGYAYQTGAAEADVCWLMYRVTGDTKYLGCGGKGVQEW